MAWLGLDKLLLGTDLTAEQQRSDSLDAQINAANQKAADLGYVSQDYVTNAAADIQKADLEGGMNDVVGSVDQEFEAGLKEGLNNVLTAPGKAIGALGSGAGTLLGGIIKNIPWWVWLGLVGALFVWMGGLSLLKGRFEK